MKKSSTVVFALSFTIFVLGILTGCGGGNAKISGMETTKKVQIEQAPEIGITGTPTPSPSPTP
jgi:hypothetical protein